MSFYHDIILAGMAEQGEDITHIHSREKHHYNSNDIQLFTNVSDISWCPIYIAKSSIRTYLIIQLCMSLCKLFNALHSSTYLNPGWINFCVNIHNIAANSTHM